MKEMPPSFLPGDSTKSLCVEVGQEALMLEFCLASGKRLAFPYSRLLTCEWDEAADGSVKRLLVRYPSCEVWVTGRHLETFRESLERFQVTRLEVVDPFRVFEAGPTLIDSIAVVGLNY